MDKVILRKWLKAGYMERNVLHPTEAGTPQGGICSPVIANLVLDGLEDRWQQIKHGHVFRLAASQCRYVGALVAAPY